MLTQIRNKLRNICERVATIKNNLSASHIGYHFKFCNGLFHLKPKKNDTKYDKEQFNGRINNAKQNNS